MRDHAARSLPHGDRWFVDGFDVLPPAGGMIILQCDMSQAREVIAALRERGLRATYTHLLVRAAALALKRNPDSHEWTCGYRRMLPDHADIGLSVAGQTSYAPVFVIPAAEERPLPRLIPFMAEGVEATRIKETKDLAGMRRNGWIIPLGAVRRFILRILNRQFWFRRKIAGTFQITCLPSVDMVEAITFYTGTAMGAGKVADRVIAVGGVPVVRPTMWLTMGIDHKGIDGRKAAVLLNAIKDILEGEELLQEVPEEVPLKRQAPPGRCDGRGDEHAAIPFREDDPALVPEPVRLHGGGPGNLGAR